MLLVVYLNFVACSLLMIKGGFQHILVQLFDAT